MEAILEKKVPKMTGRWTSRLFRLKDRRLMYFKKDVLDFNLALDSSAKHMLDLTHLISLTIDKKHDNILIIHHPVLDIALRFSQNELFMSWLRVLSSFTNISNGPKIETSLPSNYLYSIWNVLQSLYTHPHLTTMEGIFRISANKNERKLIFNHLLQQTFNINQLKNYKNIHILANLLSALLTNLPSTVFKEKQLSTLILYFDSIIIEHNKNAQNIQVDDDVATIPSQILLKLKLKIEEFYIDGYRYGLMTLIFHLLKQVIMNQENTRMSAESLSRIFVDVLESKIFLIKMHASNLNVNLYKMFRMKLLIKCLIFHAYVLFPEQQWTICDIVVAEKCEIATINLYNQCRKLRNKNKLRNKFFLNKKKKTAAKASGPQIRYNGNDNNIQFVSHFKNPLTQSITNQNHNGVPAKAAAAKKIYAFSIEKPKLRSRRSLNTDKISKKNTKKHKHNNYSIDYKSYDDGDITYEYKSDEDEDEEYKYNIVEPVDIHEFVSNINGFKKGGNLTETAFLGHNLQFSNEYPLDLDEKKRNQKRNTDPSNAINLYKQLPQSARHRQRRLHNDTDMDDIDINEALCNLNNNDNTNTIIPSGHSKNDTIITTLALHGINFFEVNKKMDNHEVDTNAAQWLGNVSNQIIEADVEKVMD